MAMEGGADPSDFFDARVVHVDFTVVVALRGELDHWTRELLWEVIISLSEDADLVLDLRRLDFIDDGGLGVLVRSTKRVRSVQLCDVSPWVMRLLGLTGLDALFPVVSTSWNTPGSVLARRDSRAEQDTSTVGVC